MQSYKRRNIGTILVERGSLDPEKIPAVLDQLGSSKQRFGEICVREGFIDGDQLAMALAEQFNLPYVDLREFRMDEEILNALVKVSDLKVASRTSAFAFKGHQGDVREIAEKLGVATVLEGSVRKAGNRVRITGQLIGAADGYHLQSDSPAIDSGETTECMALTGGVDIDGEPRTGVCDAGPDEYH